MDTNPDLGRLLASLREGPAGRALGMPPGSSDPDPAPPRRHILTRDDARRGGLAVWEGTTALDRSRAMMHLVRRQWDRRSPAERLKWARRLNEARRQLSAWQPAPPMQPRLSPQPCHWPQPCERCGSLEVTAWARQPRIYAGWIWRCQRHRPRTR